MTQDNSNTNKKQPSEAATEKKSALASIKNHKKKFIFIGGGILCFVILISILAAFKHRYGGYRYYERFSSGDYRGQRHGGRDQRHYDGRHQAFSFTKQHSFITGSAFGDHLNNYDNDGNGILSATERTTLMTARFDKIDTDSNKTISAAEFENFFTQNAVREAKARFVLMDLDNSGALELTELSDTRYRNRNKSRRGGRSEAAAIDKNNPLSEDDFLMTVQTNSTRHARATFIRTDFNQDKQISITEFESTMGVLGAGTMGTGNIWTY